MQFLGSAHSDSEANRYKTTGLRSHIHFVPSYFRDSEATSGRTHPTHSSKHQPVFHNDSIYGKPYIDFLQNVNLWLIRNIFPVNVTNIYTQCYHSPRSTQKCVYIYIQYHIISYHIIVCHIISYQIRLSYIVCYE